MLGTATRVYSSNHKKNKSETSTAPKAALNRLQQYRKINRSEYGSKITSPKYSKQYWIPELESNQVRESNLEIKSRLYIGMESIAETAATEASTVADQYQDAIEEEDLELILTTGWRTE